MYYKHTFVVVQVLLVCFISVQVDDDKLPLLQITVEISLLWFDNISGFLYFGAG